MSTMSMDGKKLRIGDEAKIAFDRAQFEKAQDMREAARPPKAPQPMLTPNGPMRHAVDQAIREKAEAIKAKLREDRARTRTQER